MKVLNLMLALTFLCYAGGVIILLGVIMWTWEVWHTHILIGLGLLGAGWLLHRLVIKRDAMVERQKGEDALYE